MWVITYNQLYSTANCTNAGFMRQVLCDYKVSMENKSVDLCSLQIMNKLVFLVGEGISPFSPLQMV